MEKKLSAGRCGELLRERMRGLFWKIAREREEIVLDGVKGCNEKAQFVGGKIINLCSYTALSFGADEAERQQMTEALRDIIDMCAGMKMETWGILNGLTGLYRLKTAGVYGQAVSQAADERLKAAMDWRTFVDEKNGWALIHKPTNYYGVAFGIARYRELLGWDEEGASAVLLDRLMDHISRYSGEYGFMDETKGEGRFDRYSILIPAEITELVLKTGWQEPELIREMLKRSAGIVLLMASESGWGFSYGRSIGAYGETAVLQILAAAARLGGIFSQEEERLAYAYSLRCLEKMVSFWYDDGMQSVNLWDKGRRTDGYRNKNRILGENLSLSMQVIDVMEEWKELGYSMEDEGEKIEGLSRDGLFFTRFAKDDFDRGLVIYRKEGHVWSLPVISGGTPYYDKDPYLPVPRENGVLEAVPDVSHGALTPELLLKDGRRLMPICFASSIEPEGEDGFRIRYDQMCIAGQNSPAAWEGKGGQELRAETVYRFKGREIEREDIFWIGKDVPAVQIQLSFETFSREAKAEAGGFSFGCGPIRSIWTENYGEGKLVPIKERERQGEALEPVDLSAAGLDRYGMREDSFDTPHGPNQTRILWSRPWRGEERLRLVWRIQF